MTSEPTTGEIVRAIRLCEEGEINCTKCPFANKSCGDLNLLAADRLESQERKITEIENFHKEMLKDHKAQVSALTARAESAERERDAAIKDIEMVMIDNMCYGCISYKNGECSRCDNRCVPKWRGLPQDGEGEMMDGEFTGERDINGTQIYVGDVLFNPFVADKWNVVVSDGNYEAWLIPNSGYIHHSNPVYPMAVQRISDIADVFEVVKVEQDGGAE